MKEFKEMCYLNGNRDYKDTFVSELRFLVFKHIYYINLRSIKILFGPFLGLIANLSPRHHFEQPNGLFWAYFYIDDFERSFGQPGGLLWVMFPA